MGAPPARRPVLALVACSQGKRSLPSPAQDLYVSDWFAKASAYARQQADVWFILSARHGLVSPDQVLEPYDESLHELPAACRTAWGQRVLAQLDAQEFGTTVPAQCLLLAGNHYREPLLRGLRSRFEDVLLPLQGLGILSQKAWLKRQLASPLQSLDTRTAKHSASAL